MSDQGLAMVENELGFLWDDQQNQFSWENLSNKSEEEGEDKPVGEKKNFGSDGGSKGNYKKAEEGPASNKKRSRGGGCKKKNNTSNKSVEQNNNGGNKVESDHEIHIWTERERRKKMRNMFSNLHALLPQLPAKADKSTIVDEAVTYIKALEETFKELKNQKLEKLSNGASTSTTTTSINSTAFTCDQPSSSTPMLIPQQNNPSNYNNISEGIITREAYLADNNDLVTMGINSTCTDKNNNSNSNNNIHQVQSHVNVPVTFQTWTSSNVVLNISGNEAHINIVCSPKKPGLFSSICYVLEKNKISLVSAQLSSDGVRCMFMIHAHANCTGASEPFVEAFSSVEEIFKQAVGEIMYWISS